ncbi:MAG: tRNA (N6-isopentenyl adenosine(37)-C2)-methylthiotransferase MiaB [Saccharofermentanaceae bacterium]|mgnify:FL=1|jgi:tRNA-2-methylthio-N6-dimethylallyladenosine synthase|nr:tRNA (N6-isopentenyl adenosine(37)-C2)-methylthiotransferase MiaB [Clostridia bacterium]NLX68016.1 tRNA (N6-isopentenyl adenosine(37)-C2)-methylthiotransferase MiaB [Clostridiaceae bacterium]
MAIVKVSSEDMKVVSSAILSLCEYFRELSAKNNRKITFYIHTYGCQLNESDSEKLHAMCLAMGLEYSKDEHADVVLFNTCAIRENAEDRLFGNLGAYKSEKISNRNMIIAVCGCMMKIEDNVSRIKNSFPYVDLVFDPQQLHKFPLLLLSSINRKKQLIEVGDVDYITDDSLVPPNRLRKFRALVPIMYGCNNFCTYCVVPNARGRERSREFQPIINEITTLAREGYKEVMLLGQNVNSYGKDAGFKETFPDLLRAISNIEGLSRVRFMTSHPKDLNREVIDIMATCKNIETHLHLPVQSGSDAILTRMNRHYNREQYLEIVRYFRSIVPNGSISTDIIVGFPGETEEDFQDTLSLVDEVKYDSAFTFQYSPRPGTEAAKYEDQIPHDVVTERFGRLLKLQNELTYESNQRLIGSLQEVLIEGESSTATNILTGRTRSNHLVNFTIPDSLKGEGEGEFDASSYEGKLCNVKITNARPYSVEGLMENLIDG